MKKFLLIITVVSTFVASCGSVTRTMSGTTESKLIKTVSIEQGCPVENVKVIDKIKSLGNATYSVEACGKRVVYKQIGSVLMEASKANETVKNMGK